MDYGHDLLFGTFVTPTAQRPGHAVELADLALRYGVGTFVVAADEAATIERFAAEVVPRTRDLVATERQTAAAA